jgi:hypothetical protein
LYACPAPGGSSHANCQNKVKRCVDTHQGISQFVTFISL